MKLKKVGSCATLAAVLLAPSLGMTADSHSHNTKQHKDGGMTMYVSASGGASLILTQDVTYKTMNMTDAQMKTVSTGTPTPNTTYTLAGLEFPLKKGAGFGGSASFGAFFNESMGAEIEGGVDMTTVLKGDADTQFTKLGTINTVAVAKDTTNAPKIDDKKMFKQTAVYGMVSGVFKIPVGEGKFTPFVKVGGGGGYFTVDGSDIEATGNLTSAVIGQQGPTLEAPIKSLVKMEEKFKKKFMFMAQGAAGVMMQVDEKISIGVSYRFLGAFSDQDLDGDNKEDNKLTVKPQRHSAMVNAVFCL